MSEPTISLRELRRYGHWASASSAGRSEAERGKALLALVEAVEAAHQDADYNPQTDRLARSLRRFRDFEEASP